MNKVNKIVIYGKGGIGKSMIAANLSMVFAKRGLKVLQVGCDPKRDSTIGILGERIKVKTVMDMVIKRGSIKLAKEDIIMHGHDNVDCIECGGPKPGVGCAGRGILLMFEILSDTGLISSGEYDVIIFDVLGDVVCGGFAAPLKINFADKIFIVTSEEPASLYAANNIAQAVRQYEYNGVYLGGLILNLRDNGSSLKHVRKFTDKLNASILASIPRSRKISDAEFKRKTLIELYPRSDVALLFADLAEKILNCKKNDSRRPRHLDENDFCKILK